MFTLYSSAMRSAMSRTNSNALTRSFKTNTGSRVCYFDDGEAVRICVCYSCDYTLNKARYSRYDKQVQESETIKAFCLNNISRWRTRAIASGFSFDLSREFLERLWLEQGGRCFYTGQVISLKRGHAQFDSASLDKVDPAKGYVIGNVVWTTRSINTSKGHRTAVEYLSLCQRVIAHSSFAILNKVSA